MNFQPLDAYLSSLLDFGFPMYDMTIHLHGREVYRRQGGFTDVAAQRRHAPFTRYFLYSASKPITCAAALTLLEQGKFRLSDPLADYMPEFAGVQVEERLPGGKSFLRPARTPIRIRDLFTMTSGLNYNLDSPSVKAVVNETNGRAPTREIARAIAREPLSFDPGDHWQYGLSHDVLAAFTEVVSGERFSEYVRRTIFEPLGMTHSGYRVPAGEALSEMAAQYRYNNAAHSADEIPRANRHILGTEYDSGGAGVISCPEDYILFADAMAMGGIGTNGARILAAPTVELMRTNFLTPAQARTFTWLHLAGYGYGLGVRTLTDRAAGGLIAPLGEFGWSGAAGALVLISPEQGAAAYFAQHTLDPHADEIFPALTNVVFSCLGR